MGTAPYSRIARVGPTSDSQLAANQLEVLKDEGAKFNAPFDALIFTPNQAPRTGAGEGGPANFCIIHVSAITDDVLTWAVVSDPSNFMAKAQGRMLATLERLQGMLATGQPITLAYAFGADDGPYTVNLHAPNGSFLADATPNIADDGAGNVNYVFKPLTSGHWHYNFSSQSHESPDEEFYVRFSDVFQ